MEARAMRTVSRRRLGGTAGNELLTSTVALVLTLLLLAEGVTLLRMDRLLSAHMFIGLVLVPPVLLKLASTGYRFARYYTNARPYREKGPPVLGLRLLAPVLVATTLAVFATGVALLAVGHRSSTVLELHKVSFILWGACFGVHFLAYLPRAAQALGSEMRKARRRRTPGAGLRLALLVGATGSGVALALLLLSSIAGWQQGGGF
jgi:hypothetical protein